MQVSFTARSEPTPRPWHTVGVVCAFAALAGATLAPVWNAPGWPLSHDGPAFAQRTAIYAHHLAVFDWLPIWTSVDNGGFGSPMPLFYHRLFYLVSGPLLLATGSAKTAVLLALELFLILGAAGAYALMRRLGADRLPSCAAGLCLIAANYTVTNWLVRGAVAELSGAMLVPWVLVAVVDALDRGTLPAALGVRLALLWHAHSVMAFYVGFLGAVTGVVLIVARRVTWRLLDPRTAWRAAGAFVLMVGPNLAAMAAVAPQFELSRFLSWPLHPSYQFRPFVWYLWDRHWTWGHTVSGLTLQLDLPMLALLGLGLGTAALHRLREWAPPHWPVLLIPAVLSLVLQMHWTEPFYLHVPGAAYIQFPWRLLAIVTPCLIALAVLIAERTLPRDIRLVAVASACAWMVAGSGAFVPLVDARIPIDPPTLQSAGFSGYREFEPTGAPPVADLRQAIESRWRDAGCTVDAPDPAVERLELHFRITCDRASVIPLPVYATPLHSVHVDRFDRPQRCGEIPDLPTACGVVVPAGPSMVAVRTPTLAAVVRDLTGIRSNTRR